MNLFSVKINGYDFAIDADNPLSIAIPLLFDGPQPNAYGVEKASSQPCRAGKLVGDTRRGGSCNFEEYKIIPHCNGTHTESVGHLTAERISVHDCLRDAFSPAALITVEPEKALGTNETYAVGLNESDRMITRKALVEALAGLPIPFFGFKNDGSSFSLVVRTLPNDDSKLSRTYLEEVPPFFSTEAMEFMSENGVAHLLVDLPSIDRLFDEGKLSNHRIFWNVEQGSFQLRKDSYIAKTITELIYVPNQIIDGIYLLNLQIAPFASDASPSRPLLFRIDEARL